MTLVLISMLLLVDFEINFGNRTSSAVIWICNNQKFWYRIKTSMTNKEKYILNENTCSFAPVKIRYRNSIDPPLCSMIILRYFIERSQIVRLLFSISLNLNTRKKPAYVQNKVLHFAHNVIKAGGSVMQSIAAGRIMRPPTFWAMDSICRQPDRSIAHGINQSLRPYGRLFIHGILRKDMAHRFLVKPWAWSGHGCTMTWEWNSDGKTDEGRPWLLTLTRIHYWTGQQSFIICNRNYACWDWQYDLNQFKLWGLDSYFYHCHGRHFVTSDFSYGPLVYKAYSLIKLVQCIQSFYRVNSRWQTEKLVYSVCLVLHLLSML